MKRFAPFLAMAVLYWHGTKEPMLQGEKAHIVCDSQNFGREVIINYTWADGSVDVRYGLLGTEHLFITDYRCLEKDK